jgi:uncharacterized RDD family membrane protein YckC
MSDHNPYASPTPPSPPNPYANPYANPQAGSPYAPGPSGAGFNPYAPPSAQSEYGYGNPNPHAHDEEILADRGTRLGAQLLDGVLAVAAGAVGAIPGVALGMEAAVVGAVVAVIALSFYQWYLISTTGQSLSKKWLGIKIVRVDGTELGFLYGVFLRIWVIQAVSALIGLVGLVDALMIFGDERRCLHDHIAGTKVIVAQS